ncbi:MAG: calcium-binding protein [Myxococcaceae bacterium]
MARPRLLLMSLLVWASSGCTDVGLYASDERGGSGPDRVDFEGQVCVPLATGEAFPVRVLFAVQGGANMDRAVVGQVTEALEALGSRFSEPYIKFSLVAFHTVATGIQGAYVDAAALQGAVVKYSSYQETGPISLRAPLRLARSFLSGDMQTGCRGIVGRTRYLVVLIFTSADTSCANPAFNAGIEGKCSAMPNPVACSSCELSEVTGALKALADQYGAGEVSIQPIYVRTTADPAASAQAAAIARQGGTQAIETDPANLKATLNGINYASLQRALVLKRLIGFNRSAISRSGELLVDSDGDGAPDVNEDLNGDGVLDPGEDLDGNGVLDPGEDLDGDGALAPAETDPANPDTDADGLMDGVERRMGMDLLTPDVVNGCNPFLDTDGDRLNDCEERVLGTDPCISDTDGDGIPDLVELLSSTNPLIPEDLEDADRDGFFNVQEIEEHTDALSADISYRNDHAYGYTIADAEPTADGRACYDFKVTNVGLVDPLERANDPFPRIRRGTNDLYLYLQVGHQSDPRGTGIGSLYISQVRFTPAGPKGPAQRKPKGTIHVGPDDFVLGF